MSEDGDDVGHFICEGCDSRHALTDEVVRYGPFLFHDGACFETWRGRDAR